MARMTKEQADQLAELERLRDAPDDDADDDQGAADDGGHVIVLRGSRADSFLADLLGPAKPARPAPAGGKGGRQQRTPAKSAADKAKAEQDADDDDQADDDQADEQPPARTNRYFR